MDWPSYLADKRRKDYDLFIDGQFVESSGDDRFDVEYAYTGDVWASAPNGTAEDIDRAVHAARDAFDNEWGDMLPSERSRILHQIADVCDEYADELAELDTLQTSRPIRDQAGQMNSLSSWFRYYAGYCDKIRGNVNPIESKEGQIFNYSVKEPLGVVGTITPWNVPLLLATFKLAPALATGNTVVEKPSEHTPIGALRFAELIHENTDLPAGVYNVVPGFGEPTGAALADHEDINKLAFTGSGRVGKEVGRKAGEKIIPVTLELGGKSPNIIFPSADLSNAVTGAMKGIFLGSGQGCVAGSRVLVHESIQEQFVDRLVEMSKDITLGDPLDETTEMGPIAYEEQCEKVKSYIDQGLEEGANLELGGAEADTEDGQFLIQPTIFSEADNDMVIAQEEIFGPVVAIIPFEDEAEAIEIANDTKYGLAAGIWTGDIPQAHRVAGEIEAGTVYVNEYRRSSYASPQGGYKKSGIGRENGEEVLQEYLQTKSVWVDLAGEVTDPFKLG